jgi:hypothetical protein
MRWLAVLLLLIPLRLPARDGSAADLATRIREAGLDRDECYRVRDVAFTKEDVRFYLTDGYVVFGKPVDGRRYSAVFISEEEGGDAEVLVFPPSRSERLSLARSAGSPNFNEHFRLAAMVFTDDTYEVLSKQLFRAGDPVKSPERGLLMEQDWNPVVRNFIASFETRVMHDSLSSLGSASGFFYAAISGNILGNFDVIYDPQRRNQITIGCVSVRDGVPYFDVWTSFQSATFRKGLRSLPPDEYRLSDYRLEATLTPDLTLKVTTRVTLTPLVDKAEVLTFDLSPRMRLTGASIDGVAAELFQRDTVRENLLRGGDSVFLLLAGSPLVRGRHYEVIFQNEGSVILSAGNDVYFVGSRDNWYPNSPAQFAQYEVTFRHPQGLDLVVAGTPDGDSAEGDWNVVRRRISTPVRFVGFNLGNYERLEVARGSYRVAVYANKRVEPGLEPRPLPFYVTVPPLGWDPQSRSALNRPLILSLPPPPQSPDSTARLKELATEVASAFEFMASNFGPPPIRTLTVSPIPGNFGQGFPGLVYLSTVSYLRPEARPAGARGQFNETFYSEILQTHEVAHQWWGNIVAAAGDQDNWVMEALANYSALLYLEMRNGPKALDAVLAEYRKRLLARAEEDRTMESMGPIIWGTRLASSRAPDAWRTITYEKGSWIAHMLRRRLGDQRFLSMLSELLRRYRHLTLSTEQFREMAARYLPAGAPDATLEAFFENWVYATGIPTLKLASAVRGKAPSLRLEITVSQSGVDENFSAFVPVEVQMRGAKPMTYWVRAESDPAALTIPIKQAPTAVVLDPTDSVLAVKR